MNNFSYSRCQLVAYIVEVLRFWDSGVLNGAADECRCSCCRRFLEKYLRSASNTLFRTYLVLWGIASVKTDRPNEGNNRENIVIQAQ